LDPIVETILLKSYCVCEFVLKWVVGSLSHFCWQTM